MIEESARVGQALILSDLHLGWSVCHRLHAQLLTHLPKAAGEAELVILNGDIFDAFRGFPRERDRQLAQTFVDIVETWRAEGRRVVYVEGNHDPLPDEPALMHPETWCFDFIGHRGERIRAIHGHRFSDEPAHSSYDDFGRRFLTVENRLLAQNRILRRTYPWVYGWITGAWGLTEDTLWKRQFPGRVRPLLNDCDALVYGHFHFGPGHGVVDTIPIHRSGAWVSRGHQGTVNRMLRYTHGRFERIALSDNGRFVPTDDGR